LLLLDSEPFSEAPVESVDETASASAAFCSVGEASAVGVEELSLPLVELESEAPELTV
jgi:hypothetical protein